jgi:sugar phosphate isomerase/epimerase
MLQLGPMLSVTLAPLVPRCGGSLPRALERIVAGGARAVQLSAAQKDLRPRDLDRQTRRELLSLIARRGLMLGGLDFMIPHKDYLQSATQDRAVAAAVSAIALAADLGRVPLSLSLPVEKLADEVAASLLAAADGHGVALAVHAEHDLEALSRFLAKHGQPLLGAGLDPAALIAAGHDPAATAAQFAPVLGVARLDDHARTASWMCWSTGPRWRSRRSCAGSWWSCAGWRSRWRACGRHWSSGNMPARSEFYFRQNETNSSTRTVEISRRPSSIQVESTSFASTGMAA